MKSKGMINKGEPLSKAEASFIKRKIDRLLKEFSTLTRGQLYEKINNIRRAVSRKG
jgi:hypothetical protein